MTGSVDDSSLVAPRWHPPELRGGLAVLRFLLLLDGVEGGRRRCRRSAQFQEFATDAVEAVVIVGGVVGGGGGAGRRRQQRARHLDEPEKGQVLRTAFVQRFAGAL